MDCIDAYGAGRVTPQRRVIAQAVSERDAAFTIDELAELVRALDPAIGLATVYRAVTAMADAGYLERVGTRCGSTLYTRCAMRRHHHHHVVCESCGRVAEAECPIATERHTSGGFLVTRHEVTLYGLCPECVSGED